MTKKSQFIQGSLVLFGTFGIIVPLSVLLLPVTGNFPPQQPLIPDGGQTVERRPAKSQLSLYLRGLNELRASPKTKLRPQQMKQLVTTIQPWKEKASMTDAQATHIIKKLAAVLTHDQRVQVNGWLEPYNGYGPPHWPNDAQGRAIRAYRKAYNPFRRPDSYLLFSLLPEEMRQRYQMRYDERMAFLKQWRDATKVQAYGPRKPSSAQAILKVRG